MTYTYTTCTPCLFFLATFQIKQRRGRLYFQEGQDDEDMTTLDMTKNIAYMHICHDRGKGVPSFDEMWISLWWKSTLTIRLRTCEDVAP